MLIKLQFWFTIYVSIENVYKYKLIYYIIIICVDKTNVCWLNQSNYFSIFRSLNLDFCSTYYQIKTLVKLQNRRNCHEMIVSIGLMEKWWRNETGTNRIVWGGGEYLVEKLMKYLIWLKCIETWLFFFIKWIQGQIGDNLLCLHMLILGIYMFFDL